MSWPILNTGHAAPTAVPPPLPNYAPNNAGGGASASASVTGSSTMNPYQYGAYQMSPEQQYYMQQQNWQQWQTYQQQYAQWHAQYGEQYQRELAAKTAIQVQPPLPGTAPPPPPPEPSMPANQNRFSQNTYPPSKINTQPTSYHYDLVTTASNPAYPSNWSTDSFADNNKQKKKKKKKPGRFGESGDNYDDSCNNENYETTDEADNEEKSSEEIAFDEQFRKWEEQFATWKRENANHPDREAYFEYENKMQECRNKLLQRRAQMRAEKRVKRIDAVQQQQQQQQQQRQQQYQSNQPAQIAQREEKPQIPSNADGGTMLIEQKEPEKPVYPTNAFVSIPGLDLLNDKNNTPRNSFRKNNFGADNYENDSLQRSRGKTKKFVRQDSVDEDNTTSFINRRPPFALKDFFDNFKYGRPSDEQNPTDSINNAGEDRFGCFNSRIKNNNSSNNNNNNNNNSIMQQKNLPQHPPALDHMNKPSNFNEKQMSIGNLSQTSTIRPLMDIEVPQFDSNDFNKSLTQNQPGKFVEQDNLINERESRFNNMPLVNNREPFSQNRTTFGGDNNMNVNFGNQTNSSNQSNISRQFVPQNKPFIRDDLRDRFDDQKSTQEITNRLVDHLIPVKVVEYNHTPKRFQILRPAKSIDYGHSHQNKRPQPEPFESSTSHMDLSPAINPFKFFSNQQRHSDMNNSRKQQPSFLTREDTNSPQFRQTTTNNPGMNRNSSNNSYNSNKISRGKWNSGNNNSNQMEPQLDASPISSADEGNAPDAKRQRRMSDSQRKDNRAHVKFAERQPANDTPTSDKSSLFPINKENEGNGVSTALTGLSEATPNTPFVKIEDILCNPGRNTRPAKIVILMRGLPGSGKSHIAKLIKNKETEMGGHGRVRILSINDYFTSENEGDSDGVKNNDTDNNATYKYDAKKEETYMECLKKTFRSTVVAGMFDIIIVDCNNISLSYYLEFYTFANIYKFTPYTCEMKLDVEECIKNDIHNRTAEDIRKAFRDYKDTPAHYVKLDYSYLLKPAEELTDATAKGSLDQEKKTGETSEGTLKDPTVELTDVSTEELQDDDEDETDINALGFLKSKWDNDTSEQKLARLDGTNKPIRHTIEDYLQLDGWEPPPTSSNGKKRVRWADIEEQREQDKQRAIGFVVGQTNWDDLMGNNDGSRALNKIKYI